MLSLGNDSKLIVWDTKHGTVVTAIDHIQVREGGRAGEAGRQRAGQPGAAVC